MVLLAGDVIFGINREEFRDSTLIITLVRYSTVLYHLKGLEEIHTHRADIICHEVETRIFRIL